jgi:hypothetical protein
MGPAGTVSVPIGSESIEVRELTVAEVRAWMSEIEAIPQRDALHALALEDCGIDDLARMCNVSTHQLEAFSPSQLAPVVAAAKELNPHFFRVRAALNSVARTMMAQAIEDGI